MRKKQYKIIVNWTDTLSIERAEQLKAIYENKGYKLIHSCTNPMNDTTILVYEE